jgi:HTH-type transcriptional regulator/antitoxin HigA
MNIQAIYSENDYQNALKKVEVLMDSKPNTPAFDELNILSILLESYENIHYKINIPDPIEAIKFRMVEQNLKSKDLVGIIGSKSRVSETLNKKRRLTLPIIRNLNRELNIPFENLISNYQITTKTI